MSNVRRWQGAHRERNLTGGWIAAEIYSGEQVRHAGAEEQTPPLPATAFIAAIRLPFLPLCWQWISSLAGEVLAPTRCCLNSTLEKVSSNSLKKPIEHLKLKRGVPLSLQTSLIVDYHSSLPSRPSVVPKEGLAQLQENSGGRPECGVLSRKEVNLF